MGIEIKKTHGEIDSIAINGEPLDREDDATWIVPKSLLKDVPFSQMPKDISFEICNYYSGGIKFINSATSYSIQRKSKNVARVIFDHGGWGEQWDGEIDYRVYMEKTRDIIKEREKKIGDIRLDSYDDHGDDIFLSFSADIKAQTFDDIITQSEQIISEIEGAVDDSHLKGNSNAKDAFEIRISDIHRLFTIHETIAGTAPGRRFELEVLNKSAILFISAYWEKYIEEMVTEAFEFMLKECDNPAVFPPKARAIVAKPLREAQDENRIWELAGDGWKTILRKNKQKVLEELVLTLNTPSYKNIDEVAAKVIGLRSLSSMWKWKSMSAQNAKDRLEKLINVRGSIAHTGSHDSPVRKKDAEDYLNFIEALVSKTDHAVYNYIRIVAGKTPW